MPTEITITLKRIIGKNQGYYYYWKYGDGGYERITKELYERHLNKQRREIFSQQVDGKGEIVFFSYKSKAWQPEDANEELNAAPKCPECDSREVSDLKRGRKIISSTLLGAGIILYFIVEPVGMGLMAIGLVLYFWRIKNRYSCQRCTAQFN